MPRAKKTALPASLDRSVAVFGQMALPNGWPIFLNGADTGLAARNRQDAVQSLSRVLVRKGHFNATVEAVDKTYQEPTDAFHFIWPPQAGAVLTKTPSKARRRRK